MNNAAVRMRDSLSIGDTGQLALPVRLDLSAASDLHGALLLRSGADLTIDAGGGAHFGGLCLQLLLAARDLWARTGHRLRVTPRSPAFAAAIDTFGLPARALEHGADE